MLPSSSIFNVLPSSRLRHFEKSTGNKFKRVPRQGNEDVGSQKVQPQSYPLTEAEKRKFAAVLPKCSIGDVLTPETSPKAAGARAVHKLKGPEKRLAISRINALKNTNEIILNLRHERECRAVEQSADSDVNRQLHKKTSVQRA